MASPSPRGRNSGLLLLLLLLLVACRQTARVEQNSVQMEAGILVSSFTGACDTDEANAYTSRLELNVSLTN